MTDIDARLDNWANWARSNNITPISCRSLECNYISPPVWHYPELKYEPDIFDAAFVETILTAPTFPKKSMAILVYDKVYPWREINSMLRRINRFKCGTFITKNNLKEHTETAKKILQNRLAFNVK
jgi:hypothetical protein